MKLALLFPGQGSQSVGMGKSLAENFPAAAQVFEAVDGALGEKLSATIFEGPEEALKMTANTQPALMAVSIAAIRALESEGFDLSQTAQAVAGHSLGEYSALCAAGALTLEDTSRLLRIRGNAMQEAVPAGKGAMAAIIGLERADVEAICAECAGDLCCQIANDNGGGQLVISGDKNPVEKAAQLAGEKGAKRAVMLPVSAPFHSALMEPAAQVMAQALSEVTINAPSVPLYANVTAKPTSDPDQIREQLVTQVTGQVRWNESVVNMVADGFDKAFEVGAGKVLTGLNRRISRDLATSAVGTPEEVAKAMMALA